MLSFPELCFSSECENSTLALLQTFKGNYFSRAVPVMILFTSVSEKQIFKPIAEAWHQNEAPKSAFWFGSSTYRLHRYRCHISTRFRYPALAATREVVEWTVLVIIKMQTDRQTHRFLPLLERKICTAPFLRSFKYSVFQCFSGLSNNWFH